MGKVVDISSKLKNEETFLKIGEKTYKVDTRKNTVMEIMEQIEKMQNENNDMASFKFADDVVKKALGVKGYNEIAKQDIDMADYMIVVKGVMAAITGTSFEELDQSFRG